MAGQRDRRRPLDRQTRVLARFAVAAIVVGMTGVIIGVVTGQSLAVVTIDALIIVIAALTLLALRLRR